MNVPESVAGLFIVLEMAQCDKVMGTVTGVMDCDKMRVCHGVTGCDVDRV